MGILKVVESCFSGTRRGRRTPISASTAEGSMPVLSIGSSATTAASTSAETAGYRRTTNALERFARRRRTSGSSTARMEGSIPMDNPVAQKGRGKDLHSVPSETPGKDRKLKGFDHPGWEVGMFILILGIALIIGIYITSLASEQITSLEAPCNGYHPANQSYNASRLYLWNNETKTCEYFDASSIAN